MNFGLEDRIALRPGTERYSGPDGGLVLALGDRFLRLRGPAMSVLGLLDGTRTFGQIVASLSSEERQPVERFLAALGAHGFLDPAAVEGPNPRPELIRALADLGLSAAVAMERLARSSIAVVADPPLGEALARALLASAIATEGTALLQLTPEEDLAQIAPDREAFVVAAFGPRPTLLARANEFSLKRGLPWIPLEIDGFSFRLGPFFLPWQTACCECIMRRRALARGAAHGLADLRALHPEIRRPADAWSPAALEIGAQLCALEVQRFLLSPVAEVQPLLLDRWLEISLDRHDWRSHHALRLPRCPACGARAAGSPPTAAWTSHFEANPSSGDGG